MSTNGGRSWHHFSLLFGFVCRNQMGDMAELALTDGRDSFVGVSLEKQRLFPFPGWTEQRTGAVSVFS